MSAQRSNASTKRARRSRALLFRPEGRRFVAGVVLIALVLFGQDLLGMATAGNRLDASLRGAQDSRDVIVVLNFMPERFHSERLAQFGVFAGRAGGANRVRLRMVSADNLRRLANIVWVARIEPLR